MQSGIEQTEYPGASALYPGRKGAMGAGSGTGGEGGFGGVGRGGGGALECAQLRLHLRSVLEQAPNPGWFEEMPGTLEKCGLTIQDKCHAQ